MVKNAQRFFAPPLECCTPLCDIRIIRCSAWKGKASGCFSVLWPMVSKNFVFVFVQFWRYTVAAQNTVSRKHEFFVFFGETDEEISPAYFHFLYISRTFNLFFVHISDTKNPCWKRTVLSRETPFFRFLGKHSHYVSLAAVFNEHRAHLCAACRIAAQCTARLAQRRSI